MPNKKHPTFTEYASAGLVVIPEIEARPQVNGDYIKWAQYNKNNKPSVEELALWDKLKNHGFGLLTGETSGVIQVDIDDSTEEETAKILALLPKTPVMKKGSKGLGLFYKYNGEVNTTFQKPVDKDNPQGKKRMLLEILSTGRKTTLPPSLHRHTGNEYVWTGSATLLEAYNSLPTLSPDIITKLDGALNVSRAIPQEHYSFPRSDFSYPDNYDEVVRALNECNPDCSWDEWVKIGLSLKSKYEYAFDIWDSWSARGKSYPGSRENWDVWRGFNPHSVSISTMFYFAKLGGYRPPQQEYPVIKATNIDHWEKRKLEIKAETIQKSKELPAFYTQAPEHIRIITDWILSTSLYPQPIITLGSVMAFLGFVMGRDFQYNSLRSNLYIANIAYSADGKEHINRCIRGLMTKCNLSQHLAYGWTSDTAIISHLTDNGAKAFYLTDELQAALRSISQKGSNAREGGATEALLQAYTGVELRTVGKADTKLNPTKIVKNPFVTICGYTTPAIFEQCLGSTEVFSGFVGRLTVFRGNKLIPEENEDFEGNAWENVPQNVIDAVEGIRNNRQREYTADGGVVYAQKAIPTQHLALIKDYREKIRQKRNEMRLDGDPLEAIFGRAGEVMLKYAIIASQGKEILEHHIHWAISMVEYNLGIMCETAENFADNKFERNKIKLIQFIQHKGGQTDKTDINNNSRIFDSARERNEALKDLVESGRIEPIEIKTATKSKTGYRIISTVENSG